MECNPLTYLFTGKYQQIVALLQDITLPLEVIGEIDLGKIVEAKTE
jgi:hypothetical protein